MFSFENYYLNIVFPGKVNISLFYFIFLILGEWGSEGLQHNEGHVPLSTGIEHGVMNQFLPSYR